MIEGLKYYKESGKINLVRYIPLAIISIIITYYLGLLFDYFNQHFYLFLIEKVADSGILGHTKELSQVMTKVSVRTPFFWVIILIIGFLPFLIYITLFCLIIIGFKKYGQSRNSYTDIILFICLSLICFFVGNNYKLDSIGDYIELVIFLALSILFGSMTNFYCEKCLKPTNSSNFYTISPLNAEDFLEEVIKDGGQFYKRYKEQSLFEIENIENIFKLNVEKCKTCGFHIVNIDSYKIVIENEKEILKFNKIIIRRLIVNL